MFCDFDGTVAQKDVGRELFSHFTGGRAAEIAHQYRDGLITAQECLLSKAAMVSGITPAQFGTFVDQFTIDEYFVEFRDFCLSNNIPLTILSDGLDFYVERILNRNGLGGSTSFANQLEFRNIDGVTRMEVSFRYTDSECHFCGNCKRNHMLNFSSDEDIIVYVGDGISDRCPVRHADIVFAKADLISFCQEENISYFEYLDFRDVERRLELLLSKKRIKKRREAGMARRDVFMQG